MIDFNEIWDNDGFLSSCSRADAEHFYNAGQQSKIDKLKSDNQLSESQIGQACVKWKEIAEKRQAKIDELQKKLDCCREENKALLIKLSELKLVTETHNNTIQALCKKLNEVLR